MFLKKRSRIANDISRIVAPDGENALFHAAVNLESAEWFRHIKSNMDRNDFDKWISDIVKAELMLANIDLRNSPADSDGNDFYTSTARGRVFFFREFLKILEKHSR